MSQPSSAAAGTAAPVWPLLLAARRAAAGLASDATAQLSVDRAGRVAAEATADAVATIGFADGSWHVVACGSERVLLDLYLPLCAASPARPLVIAHLGQSLDGQIATATGDSDFVTGPQNLEHLHRLRALADAIVVGAGTVASDDPQLTTRRVDGADPVRVVIDPDRRLPATHRVFAGAGRSIRVHAASGAPSGDAADRRPATERMAELAVPAGDDGLDLTVLLERLRARGLDSVFVEGGGRTVSAFVAAGLVDRLQIAIAPLLIGTGHVGLALPPQSAMADCPRPASRIFAMGDDVLFDCDLRAAAAAVAESPQTGRIG